VGVLLIGPFVFVSQILAPFMLRRVKSEVCLDIPKKKEVVVHAPMTDMQFKLYQAVLEKKVGVLKNEVSYWYSEFHVSQTAN